MVAYNAAGTLARVLDRIPESFRPRIDEVLVCDDSSQDSTYLVGLGYQQLSSLPITVVRHERNLGYGGNQKAGYRMAIERGLDIVVLLHGDGQYAPEHIEALVNPLADNRCDAVFGSRMMVAGDARRGGMPLYKYVGNKVLTRFQNGVLGTELTEFHSGYRAYSVRALESVPFDDNSDGFNFDTQIILQLLDAGKRIVEVPIPTFYGDEICYVNGLKYAKDIVADVVRYRAHKIGLGGSPVLDLSEPALAPRDGVAQLHLTQLLASYQPSRILYLGRLTTEVATRLCDAGHRIVAVVAEPSKALDRQLERCVVADLDEGIPPIGGAPFDVVVATDLEHLRSPERVLFEARRLLRAAGTALVSVPNFGHWYPRARVTLGLFDYDRRGILDREHLRFFTRRSFRTLARRTGWKVTRVDPIGLPLDLFLTSESALSRSLRSADRLLATTRSPLFAYEFVFQLHPGGPPNRSREEIDVTDSERATADDVTGWRGVDPRVIQLPAGRAGPPTRRPG